MYAFLLEYYIRNELERIEESIGTHIQIVSVDNRSVCVTYTIVDLILGTKYLLAKTNIGNREPKEILDVLVKNINDRIKLERSKT